MASRDSFVFYSKGIQYKSFFDEKANKQRFFVKGLIDTGDLDLVNDIVTKECMLDLSEQLKGRNIKLDFDHETLRASKDDSAQDAQLNLAKIPLGKAVSESLNEKGNEVEFELNPNWKKFDSKGNVVMTFKEIWDNIKGGFYDAFSIAYVPVKTAMKQIGDTKARLLDKINLINVALTGNPINPNATMTAVMAKSLQYMQDVEDTEQIIKDLKSEIVEIKSILKGEKKMKKEVKDEEEKKVEGEKPEETPTPKEPNEAKGEEENKPVEEEKPEKPEEKAFDFKAFSAEIKSEIGELKKEIGEINKILEKAAHKAYGAPSKEKIAEKSESNSPVKEGRVLDLI